MLRTILNKSWRQYPTKQQLYGHLPPITKTIQNGWTRHAEYCWKSKNELISDILRWTPSHGRAKAGRPVWTYIQQLCADTGCSFEDLPEAMDNREGGQERVREIRAGGATWWWWWWRINTNLTVRVYVFLFLNSTMKKRIFISPCSGRDLFKPNLIFYYIRGAYDKFPDFFRMGI